MGTHNHHYHPPSTVGYLASHGSSLTETSLPIPDHHSKLTEQDDDSPSLLTIIASDLLNLPYISLSLSFCVSAHIRIASSGVVCRSARLQMRVSCSESLLI
ncbi:hypothetical protein DM860_002035 [Cuscuta australis]|uniref:Uncharacterized protein n=1 Tax=Cuscuta australis TaxID=267555 RepID=A0A328DVM3_9ASTE|nr:hypothetical protein DM860_002035 [Cuscuta australis]